MASKFAITRNSVNPGSLQCVPDDDEEGQTSKLDLLREGIDRAFDPDSDISTFAEVKVKTTDIVDNFLSLHPLSLLGVFSDIEADKLHLNLFLNELSLSRMRFDVRNNSMVSFSRHVLDEFKFIFDFGRKSSSAEAVLSFKDMEAAGRILEWSKTGFAFEVMTSDEEDFAVVVMFSNDPIVNSPLVISRRKNTAFQLAVPQDSLLKMVHNKDTVVDVMAAALHEGVREAEEGKPEAEPDNWRSLRAADEDERNNDAHMTRMDESDLKSIGVVNVTRRTNTYPVHSPARSHLPLDQPSPVIQIQQIRSMSNRVGEREEFLPDIASTASCAQLKSIFDAVADDAVDLVTNVQKNLSKEEPAKVEAGTEDEENNGKAVSFAHEHTIFEVMKSDSGDSANMTIRQLVDVVSENPEVSQSQNFKITFGQTKTKDGDLGLSRNMLARQNRTGSNNGYIDDDSEDEDCYWDGDEEGSEASNWDEPNTLKAKQNLLEKNLKFVLVKSYPLPGIPSDVSVLSDGETVFVTDTQNNKVFFRRGLGMTPGLMQFGVCTEFVTPRTVLCISGARVCVMDSKALYVFDRKGKRLRRMFAGETSKFRGLAWDADYGRMMTTVVKDDGLYIMTFSIDASQRKEPVKDLSKMEGIEVKKVKVRYLTWHKGVLYATDLEQGLVYAVDMSRRSESGHYPVDTWSNFMDGSNKFKQATGVCCDPSGNVLVASTYHATIELVSSDQKAHKTFTMADLTKPMGLCFKNNFLYVVSADQKALYIYFLSQEH